MKRSIIVDGICYFFFLLFMYTALSKWLIFPLFVQDLGRSPGTSSYATLIAISVPVVEFMVAIMLLVPRTRKWGLYGVFILLLVFTIYVGYVLGMTSERPCSCGGIFRDMSWRNHMYLNSAMTLLALAGIWLNKRLSLEKGHSNKLAHLANDHFKL